MKIMIFSLIRIAPHGITSLSSFLSPLSHSATYFIYCFHDFSLSTSSNGLFEFNVLCAKEISEKIQLCAFFCFGVAISLLLIFLSSSHLNSLLSRSHTFSDFCDVRIKLNV